MQSLRLQPAERPTMYFVGVTTAKSMIMRVFPKWARYLELGNCEIKGIDLAQHDEPERYRGVVSFIKDDPLSLGALVTTHKIDLLRASRDLFDELDHFASLMGEVSSISKSNSRLFGGAKDPITSGLALADFLPAQHWATTGAHAFIMGAGGSSIALCSSISRTQHGGNRPARIVISNRSPGRLAEMKEINRKQDIDLPVEYVLSPQPQNNDAVMRTLPPGSLVVNATGLGKDAIGSPVSEAAAFPERGFAWDFNYRGDLLFLEQARRQAAVLNLHVEDGWLYFIYGWLAVIAEVFHRDIPVRGDTFAELRAIAEGERDRG
ncbi:MAG: shikimate dehydrogenase [Spirochaetia bacterium]